MKHFIFTIGLILFLASCSSQQTDTVQENVGADKVSEIVSENSNTVATSGSVETLSLTGNLK